MFKQTLLAAVLIAVPVGIFTGAEILFAPPAQSEQSLGDLTPLFAITTDVQKIAATGDMTAAEKRITDFETEWDKDQSTMRPLNPAAWGTIDDAADTAIHSLRSGNPDPQKVNSAVKDLIATLANPYTSADDTGATVKMVTGIAVTDETGHPLPCEELIKKLRAAIDGSKIPQDKTSTSQNFLSKALERCNADDDTHANEFSAQGLALAAQ
jgi:hypothetical protein